MWRIRGPEESTYIQRPARLEIDYWGGNARPPSTQGTHLLNYKRIFLFFPTKPLYKSLTLTTRPLGHLWRKCTQFNYKCKLPVQWSGHRGRRSGIAPGLVEASFLLLPSITRAFTAWRAACSMGSVLYLPSPMLIRAFVGHLRRGGPARLSWDGEERLYTVARIEREMSEKERDGGLQGIGWTKRMLTYSSCWRT